MTKNDWRKFVKINTAITLNVIYIIKININPAYISKHNLNHENEIIL